MEGQAVIATYTTKDWATETPIKPIEISGSVEGQAVIATYTTKDWVTETPIKPTEISGSVEGQAVITTYTTKDWATETPIRRSRQRSLKIEVQQQWSQWRSSSYN